MLTKIKIVLSVAMISLASNYSLLAANAIPVEVPTGTRVPVTISNTVSSNNVKAADTINFSVAQDVSVDGHIVFPKGAPVTINVEKAQSAGKMGRPGLVTLNGGQAADIEGNNHPLNISYSAKGRSRRAFSVTMTILSVPLILAFGVGLITMPIAIMTSGKDASVGQGLVLDALTTAPASVNIGEE